MKTNNTLILFLIFLYQMTFGQTAGEKIIHGKIIIESRHIPGVTIINLVNEKSTVSDSNGEFFILAKAEDLLVFTSVNLEYHRKLIEQEDLKPELLIIKMIAKITELEEVIINKHPEINAVALGISPKGIIQRTRAEKRLDAANSMPIAALINLMSGRTEQLKKEIEVEKKKLLLVKLDGLYDDEYYIQRLKIPPDYINGFKHYIIENEKFTVVFKSRDKKMTEFLMVDLAVAYNEIISNEN